MKLAERLLLGSLLVVGVLVAFVIVIAGRRIENRLAQETTATLASEARLVGLQWTRGVDADSLADRAGAALGHHVSLVDSAGLIAGDSDFDRPTLARLESQLPLREIAAARAGATGSSTRVSPSTGEEELHVAVPAPRGVARVSMTTRALEEVLGRAKRDVVVAALPALLIAIALSYWLARSISRPIVELSNGAAKLASGDLSHRFSLIGSGEVGDLASALRRMADELGSRFSALESEDVLMVAVIESLSEGVVVFDTRGRIVRINESARRLLGVTSTIPAPSDWMPRDRVLREAISGSIAGEDIAPAETTIDERILVITARALPAGGAVLTLFDLTPLRRIEMVRRDFVANASHELKTPLTVIGGFAETLAEDDPPEPQRRQFAAAIRSNAQRMQRLVDDLLDLSRIESGGWVPNPIDLDIRIVAEELLAPERIRILSPGVQTELTIAVGAERVYVDPTALRQILTNLIENAARHTEAGTVRVFSTAEPGGIWIGVEDTGTGIPQAHLPRIFERFYRADPSRVRGPGGTGLGLAIVKHLAEAHGGRVRAESTVGKGTLVAALFPHRAIVTNA